MGDASLTLQKFSTLVSINASELKRQFARHETTYHRELVASRSRRAQRLLKTTDLPVGIIGERVGFPEASGFAKAFRKWTGQTPTEFRLSSSVTRSSGHIQ